MPTYIWCKGCHKMIAKELLHEDCEPNEVTKAAMQEALNDEPQWIENWYA